jgi:hypothetical protein
LNELEEQLAKIFLEKMPELSGNAKEMSVKFLPWVLIVLGVFGLLAWLSAIGLFHFASLVVMGLGHAPRQTFSLFTVLFLYILAPVMQALAVGGGYLMLSRRLTGWRIAFYSLLVSFIVHLAYFSIFGLFLDLAFAYLLFQTKEYYS